MTVTTTTAEIDFETLDLAASGEDWAAVREALEAAVTEGTVGIRASLEALERLGL